MSVRSTDVRSTDAWSSQSSPADRPTDGIAQRIAEAAQSAAAQTSPVGNPAELAPAPGAGAPVPALVRERGERDLD